MYQSLSSLNISAGGEFGGEITVAKESGEDSADEGCDEFSMLSGETFTR